MSERQVERGEGPADLQYKVSGMRTPSIRSDARPIRRY